MPVQLIKISDIISDKRNANAFDPIMLEKLERNIVKYGVVQPPLVRPHSRKPGKVITVDGHHRIAVAKSLGIKEIECIVKTLSRQEAAELLLTLNTVRGQQIPRKRAELIESLLPNFDIDELSTMLPEGPDEIKGLLALLKQDDDAMEKALRKQIEEETKMMPVPLGFMVSSEDAEIVYEALKLYQRNQGGNQSQALVAICRDVITKSEG